MCSGVTSPRPLAASGAVHTALAVCDALASSESVSVAAQPTSSTAVRPCASIAWYASCTVASSVYTVGVFTARRRLTACEIRERDRETEEEPARIDTGAQTQSAHAKHNEKKK